MTKFEFNIKLTNKQKRHLPTVKWLIDDSIRNRGTGRSTVIAHALASKAVDNPGTWVHLGSSNCSFYAVDYILKLIIYIIPKNVIWRYKHSIQSIIVDRIEVNEGDKK